MDVNRIANPATNITQERVCQEVGVAVLEKALDVQANTSIPSNLGWVVTAAA